MRGNLAVGITSPPRSNGTIGVLCAPTRNWVRPGRDLGGGSGLPEAGR